MSGVYEAERAWGKRVSREYVPAFPLGNRKDAEQIARQSGRSLAAVLESLRKVAGPSIEVEMVDEVEVVAEK